MKTINLQILNCSICLKSARGKLVVGEGNPKADIVVVGEAPGRKEIETGQPFIGPAGKILDGLLAKAKLDRKDIFITSAVKYLPIGYVTPKLKDIKHGREHLFSQLRSIKPKVVILLGHTAAQSVLGNKVSLPKFHGKVVEERDGIKYMIFYHPAAALYSRKLLPTMEEDFRKLKKYL